MTNHYDFFKNAIWVSAKDPDICPVIRKSFVLDRAPEQAVITALGFGSFICYINGEPITKDMFLPLASEYEARSMPPDEELAYISYPCRYDVTSFLKKGKNTIAFILGNGLYTSDHWTMVPYGTKKLCFCIDADGQSVVSDATELCRDSFVKYSDLHRGEHHDYSSEDLDMLLPEFDDSDWERVVEADAPDTVYALTDCPCDRVVGSVAPTLLFSDGERAIYDAGENLTGFPIITTLSGSDEIHVSFSEVLTPEGELDFDHGFYQRFKIKSAGRELECSPLFTWLAFRYFEIKGKALSNTVLKIHGDIPVSSHFECNNETINWIYNAYINTQLCNMHSGIPSDCPHIERRGYTGDGQLTCHAAMMTLDSKKFYRKWIRDISNCQDRKSGHIQYTAPYTKSGGGPGGWGSAIVALPYEYYKAFGDEAPMRELYPQMLKYFEFMEAHSENGLVTSDSPNAWCLGDWCTPGPVVLPAPFVNNYFYIISMQRAIEIASLIGKEQDIPVLEERIKERKKAILAAYFNAWDGNFIGNLQGANAFALDIGLGDERTKENLIKYYENIGHYDTGIFGTDIVTRLLFDYGRGDIACRLLSASEPHGFGKWRASGATSLWEEWKTSRSHSHPMFGAVVAYFFEYVLGIKQAQGSVAFNKVMISPAKIDGIDRASGYISTPHGRISVSYTVENGEMHLSADIPDGVNAEIVLPDGESKTVSGRFSAEL